MAGGEDSTEKLFDIIHCRAENVGIEGLAECLDVGPKACPYAVPFGYAFLCQHPRLRVILENTHRERIAPPQGS